MQPANVRLQQFIFGNARVKISKRYKKTREKALKKEENFELSDIK